MDLSELRDRLTTVDRELIALVAERQRLSREIARAKRATGHPTRDFRRERDVIVNARTNAERLGVPAGSRGGRCCASSSAPRSPRRSRRRSQPPPAGTASARS